MAWALCAPSVTNMHMFNCARKRFDSKPRDRKREREKDRGRNERVALLTNLLFDFCISVFDIFNSSSSSSHRNNSKMAKDLSTLGWDYFMFAAFIALTVLGPLWTRLFGKTKQRSKADYVFATGGVSIVAVMISIARGTLGVRSVLGKFRALPLSLSLSHLLLYIFFPRLAGYPSELYYRGSAMWEIVYGMMSAYPIVCFMFVPVYFNLGITSVYQYIDLR